MDQFLDKTQNQEFVSQILPDLFHSAPDPFLFYLNRDGTKFLNFYWNEAGKQVNPAYRKPAFGINYAIRAPSPKVTVALIQMPTPVGAGEAHLVALCYRPTRIAPLLGIGDTSKVLVLEHSTEDATLLIERTRRLKRAVLAYDIDPKLENFYEVVLKEIAN